MGKNRKRKPRQKGRFKRLAGDRSLLPPMNKPVPSWSSSYHQRARAEIPGLEEIIYEALNPGEPRQAALNRMDVLHIMDDCSNHEILLQTSTRTIMLLYRQGMGSGFFVEVLPLRHVVRRSIGYSSRLLAMKAYNQAKVSWVESRVLSGSP